MGQELPMAGLKLTRSKTILWLGKDGVIQLWLEHCPHSMLLGRSKRPKFARLKYFWAIFAALTK